MAIRYATKLVNLDGKSYNAGDIIPEQLGDRAGAEKWSRLEGEAIPTPETPAIGITSKELDTETETEEETEEEITQADIDAGVEAFNQLSTEDQDAAREEAQKEAAKVTPPKRGRGKNK